jgi:hypothetical protein
MHRYRLEMLALVVLVACGGNEADVGDGDGSEASGPMPGTTDDGGDATSRGNDGEGETAVSTSSADASTDGGSTDDGGGTETDCSAAGVFVAPTGDDASDCADAAPCASLARAYEVAADGDVVLVRAGSYGDQIVGEGTKAVTFCGEPGAVVAHLDNAASNVTFDRIEVDGQFVKFLGFHNSGDDVTFKNSRIGNVTDEKGALVSGANFTFDNVEFHDVLVTDPEVHNECLYAIVVPGFTIRRSWFHDCATMDLFFTHGLWWDPVPPAYGDVTVENNVFGHSTMIEPGSWHYYSMYVANIGPEPTDPMTNWVVRYNTFEIDVAADHYAVVSRWVGNVGAWPCVDGMAYSHNVGNACAESDVEITPAASNAETTAPFGWRDPANHDFHLVDGSPAIDAGDPADAPATDRDGNPRPVGAAPDAGAYEYDAR